MSEVPAVDYFEDLRRIVGYGDLTCHGAVTRDWEQDVCEKPATTIVRMFWEGSIITWPACTYHAHMTGNGASVPLTEILRTVAR